LVIGVRGLASRSRSADFSILLTAFLGGPSTMG
jgi:hypothetical protein